MNTAAQKPLRDGNLLRTAVNKILNEPECWNQRITHCGTKHSLGGWIQILAGLSPDGDVIYDLMSLLGISNMEAQWLYSYNRTIGEIYSYAKNFERHGYDRDGRDRAGYDRAGYDRDGYNRDGRDRFGYDRTGYDCDGYDRLGMKLTPFEV